MTTDRPTDGEPGSKASDQQALTQAVGALLGPHETQTLGLMGLLIGYICIFLVKILNFTNINLAVGGVAVLTLLILASNKSLVFSLNWCIRSLTAIIICLLVTGPQLYFAWTVSVAELQAAIEAQHRREIESAAARSVTPSITITNTDTGAPK